jgi:hypothetical protein
MGARAQEEAPEGPACLASYGRRGWSGVTRRHHQGCPSVSTAELCGSFRWMQAPAPAATCCRLTHEQRGDHLLPTRPGPTPPTAQRRTRSTAWADPTMLEASPTGTLRGYIDQARLRAAALISRRTYDSATNRYKQPRVARRRGGSRHYLSHGEASTELSCLGPAPYSENFTQCACGFPIESQPCSNQIWS